MDFKVGDIVEGKVTGIKNYGAFVDIGEGKSGMVFISEIAHTYVEDINEHLQLGQSVKAMITAVSEDGKISLSIKRTLEAPKRSQHKDKSEHSRSEGAQRERRQFTPPPKPDGSYTWMPKKQEAGSLDDMINRFKQTSDDKFSDLKRRNPEVRRSKRGTSLK